MFYAAEKYGRATGLSAARGGRELYGSPSNEKLGSPCGGDII